jgi:hypothetical protein
MLNGATTRSGQLKLAGGVPMLSTRVALTVMVPGVVGVPLTVMLLPVLEEGVSGDALTFQV